MDLQVDAPAAPATIDADDTAVAVTDYDFAGAVRIAREAMLRRRKDLWLIADLTAEAAPAGIPGGHDDRLRDFARQIGWFDEGWSLDTLRDHRRTATVWAWPDRHDPSGRLMSIWTARLLNGYEPAERAELLRDAADMHRQGCVTEGNVKKLLRERNRKPRPVDVPPPAVGVAESSEPWVGLSEAYRRDQLIRMAILDSLDAIVDRAIAFGPTTDERERLRAVRLDLIAIVQCYLDRMFELPMLPGGTFNPMDPWRPVVYKRPATANADDPEEWLGTFMRDIDPEDWVDALVRDADWEPRIGSA